MNKLTKGMTLGVSAVVLSCTVFLSYDYLDNQKKAEQSKAFMEESYQVMRDYDYTSLGIDIHHKTINVQGTIANEKHNQLAHSLGLVANHHGMGDFRVIVTSESE